MVHERTDFHHSGETFEIFGIRVNCSLFALGNLWYRAPIQTCVGRFAVSCRRSSSRRHQKKPSQYCNIGVPMTRTTLGSPDEVTELRAGEGCSHIHVSHSCNVNTSWIFMTSSLAYLIPKPARKYKSRWHPDSEPPQVKIILGTFFKTNLFRFLAIIGSRCRYVKQRRFGTQINFRRSSCSSHTERFEEWMNL